MSPPPSFTSSASLGAAGPQWGPSADKEEEDMTPLSLGFRNGGMPREILSRAGGNPGIILMAGAQHFGGTKMQAIRWSASLSGAVLTADITPTSELPSLPKG